MKKLFYALMMCSALLLLACGEWTDGNKLELIKTRKGAFFGDDPIKI